MSKFLAFLLGALLCWPAWAQQVPDPVSRTAPAVITDKKTGGITGDGAGLTALSNNTYTAHQIYQMTTTVPVNSYDAIRGVAVATPGTTVEGVMGVAGYAIATKPTGTPGNSGNPVPLFGVGVAASDNATVWGLNTVLTDTTLPGVVSAGVGRELWHELNFNVTSPGTTVRGLVFSGTSIAQPALAIANEVRPLGANSHWTVAFGSQAGAATTGLVLGIQGVTGAVSSPSQLVLLGWSASDGTVYNHNLHSENGSLIMDSTGIAQTGNFVLNKGGFRTADAGSVAGMVIGQQNATGFLSDSQILFFQYTNAAGVGFNNSLKTTSDGVLNLITSGGPTNGSFNLPAGARYMVNGVTGVTCAGAPTAGFATVGGIVTAC